MSLSISSYSDNSIYRTTSSNDSNKTTSAESHTDCTKKSTDALQFSDELMAYLAGYTNANDQPTDNYSLSVTGQSTLSVSTMNTILTDLQTQLNDTALESQQQPPGLAEVLATLKETLAGFDAASASEETTTNLFNTVVEELASARPEPPQGRIPPPPSLNRMKEFLSNLQEKLNTLDVSLLDTDPAVSDKLTALKTELAGFDASTATNEEQIAQLFEEIMKELHDLRPSPSWDTSSSSNNEQTSDQNGLPPLLKALGSAAIHLIGSSALPAVRTSD